MRKNLQCKQKVSLSSNISKLISYLLHCHSTESYRCSNVILRLCKPNIAWLSCLIRNENRNLLHLMNDSAYVCLISLLPAIYYSNKLLLIWFTKFYLKIMGCLNYVILIFNLILSYSRTDKVSFLY